MPSRTGVVDAALKGKIGVAEELPKMVLMAALALLVPRLLGVPSLELGVLGSAQGAETPNWSWA
jgi:hypothetical protein